MKTLWLIPAALAAFVALPQKGFAMVDMKNSNYNDTWLDITLPGAGYALRVQRYYNSRSVFSGMFGFGWCSDFETSLVKTPEGRLKVTECGAGQEIIYSSAKNNEQTADKVINDIVAYYKKNTPGATAQGAETLKGQLANSADLRAEWAKHMGLAAPSIAKGTVYTADNLEVEKIVFDGTTYTRNLADGTMEKFDSNGHLTYMYDKNGNFLKLTYGPENLKDVTDNAGKRLSFTFNANHRVKDITGPGGAKAEYKFKGEDLAEVHNMWKNKYTYEYDETHNLTRIGFPDNTFKALTYNQKQDWVTSFTDRVTGGVSCTENYKYEVDKQDPKNHYWSIATKKCGTELKSEARFEFWYKTLADGRKYLSRVYTKSLTDALDVTYHPDFGRPISIKKNNELTTFDYYANGLIKEKATNGIRMVFEYQNSFNKVSKVDSEYLDQKGKVVRKRETTFTYDPKANLVAASNSDGQSVKLTYDVRGRIATIVDQARKEVQIKYDEKIGKPSAITRPKVGTLKIVYKANGDINKVDSSDGPTVAVQIASTFNNLLDIISPATSELSL